MKPRKWQHKVKKNVVKVMPWWECPDEDDLVKDLGIMDSLREKDDPWPERQFKIGSLIQIGWLLETEHGVWLGVGPKAKDQFDDLGEWNENNQEAKDPVSVPDVERGNTETQSKE